jgi:O-antigen/teichoic acid export membrane protein
MSLAMVTILRLINKTPAVKNVFTIMSGTAAGQIISLAAAPMLTRLYSPDQYGTAGVFAGIMLMLMPLTTLQYAVSITTAQNEHDSNIAKRTALSAAVITGCAVALATIAFTPAITAGLNLTETPLITWLIPITFWMIATAQVLQATATRTQAFRAMAEANLLTTTTSVTIHLLGFNLGATGLAIGHTAGHLANSARLLYSQILLKGKERSQHTEQSITLRDVLSWGRRHWRLPVFTVPQGLAAHVSSSGLPIIIAITFSSTEAGWFILAYRAVTLPVSLVAQAVSLTFLSRIRYVHEEGRLSEAVKRVGVTIIQLALPAVGVAVLALPVIVPWVFGKEWSPAGVMAAIMLPAAVTNFLSGVLTNAIFPLKREYVGAVTQGILLAARACAVVVGVRAGDVMVALVLYALVSVVVQVGLIAWLEWLVGKERWLWRELRHGVTWAAALAAPALIATLTQTHTTTGLITSGMALMMFLGWKSRGLLRS